MPSFLDAVFASPTGSPVRFELTERDLAAPDAAGPQTFERFSEIRFFFECVSLKFVFFSPLAHAFSGYAHSEVTWLRITGVP